MPVDGTGKFRMNAQIARSPVGSKKPAAAPADPNADPAQGDPDGNVKSITITVNGDGTFHTSEPNGEENDFQDFQSAMGKAAECLGADQGDTDDQGAPALDQPSSGGSGTDGMGY